MGASTGSGWGFVDLQVNGFAGCDYNSPQSPLESIELSLEAQKATGVVRLLPTVITGPPEQIAGALRNLSKAQQAAALGGMIEGFHVEGPHISAEAGPRGAHPAEWVRAPDLDEFERWQEAAEGGVRLVTLAPEWPGATAYIEALVGRGVVVSIGHSAATAEQIREAVRAGATMSTHLGNAGPKTIERHPNYLWEQLAEDRLSASFIVDGYHLPESFLKAAVRAKTVERSVLITDAVAPAGCPPGPYKLGVVDIELREPDRVTLAGGERLAGSALRMDRAIGNAVRQAGVSLEDALAMASRNPARVIGIEPAGHVDYEWDAVRSEFRVLAVEV